MIRRVTRTPVQATAARPALPTIIDGLRAGGYGFVILDALTG